MLHVSKLCMGDDQFEYFLLIFIYVLESGSDYAFTGLAVGKFYCIPSHSADKHALQVTICSHNTDDVLYSLYESTFNQVCNF